MADLGLWDFGQHWLETAWHVDATNMPDAASTAFA